MAQHDHGPVLDHWKLLLAGIHARDVQDGAKTRKECKDCKAFRRTNTPTRSGYVIYIYIYIWQLQLCWARVYIWWLIYIWYFIFQIFGEQGLYLISRIISSWKTENTRTSALESLFLVNYMANWSFWIRGKQCLWRPSYLSKHLLGGTLSQEKEKIWWKFSPCRSSCHSWLFRWRWCSSWWSEVVNGHSERGWAVNGFSSESSH